LCCITELLQCKSVPSSAQVSMRPCLQKYFSHPSLVIYFFFFCCPNPIDRELFRCKECPPVVVLTSVSDYQGWKHISHIQV
jgi:hypothetical protein